MRRPSGRKLKRLPPDEGETISNIGEGGAFSHLFNELDIGGLTSDEEAEITVIKLLQINLHIKEMEHKLY